MSTNQKPLAGQTAFVSGSTRGPGRIVAEAWGKAGVKVALHYLQNRQGAEESVKRFKAVGSKGLLVRADLSDEGQLEMLSESLRRELGGLDLICLNLAMREETAAKSEWQEAFRLSLKHLAPLNRAGQRTKLVVLLPHTEEGVWVKDLVAQAEAILVKSGHAARILRVQREADGGWAAERLRELAESL